MVLVYSFSCIQMLSRLRSKSGRGIALSRKLHVQTAEQTARSQVSVPYYSALNLRRVQLCPKFDRLITNSPSILTHGLRSETNQAKSLEWSSARYCSTFTHQNRRKQIQKNFFKVTIPPNVTAGTVELYFIVNYGVTTTYMPLLPELTQQYMFVQVDEDETAKNILQSVHIVGNKEVTCELKTATDTAMKQGIFELKTAMDTKKEQGMFELKTAMDTEEKPDVYELKTAMGTEEIPDVSELKTAMDTEDTFKLESAMNTEDTFELESAMNTEDTFKLKTAMNTEDTFKLESAVDTEEKPDVFELKTAMNTEDIFELEIAIDTEEKPDIVNLMITMNTKEEQKINEPNTTVTRRLESKLDTELSILEGNVSTGTDPPMITMSSESISENSIEDTSPRKPLSKFIKETINSDYYKTSASDPDCIDPSKNNRLSNGGTTNGRNMDNTLKTQILHDYPPTDFRQNSKASGVRIGGLVSARLNILVKLQEQSQDVIEKKQECYKRIEALCRKEDPDAVASMFGSSVNGFGSNSSDLDIKIDSEILGISSINAVVLRNLGREITDYKFIHMARVPVISFTYPGNIRTDITVTTGRKKDNPLLNTELLKYYSEYDERVRPVVYAIKWWADKLELTSSIDRPRPEYLGGYALILLVVFYLQSVKVIPTVQQLYLTKPLALKNRNWNVGWDKNLKPVSGNESSVEELVQGFFDFYRDFNFPNYQLQTNTGFSEKLYHKKLVFVPNYHNGNLRRSMVNVQDPFVFDYNPAHFSSEIVFRKFQNSLKTTTLDFFLK